MESPARAHQVVHGGTLAAMRFLERLDVLARVGRGAAFQSSGSFGPRELVPSLSGADPFLAHLFQVALMVVCLHKHRKTNLIGSCVSNATFVNKVLISSNCGR